MALTHKEMTAHIRHKLAFCQIPARCRMIESCGTRVIRVFGRTYESRWTVEQLRQIARIASVNGLTFVRQLPVTEDHCMQMTERASFDFYFWG